jgi:hypothetical protein
MATALERFIGDHTLRQRDPVSRHGDLNQLKRIQKMGGVA